MTLQLLLHGITECRSLTQAEDDERQMAAMSADERKRHKQRQRKEAQRAAKEAEEREKAAESLVATAATPGKEKDPKEKGSAKKAAAPKKCVLTYPNCAFVMCSADPALGSWISCFAARGYGLKIPAQKLLGSRLQSWCGMLHRRACVLSSSYIQASSV